MDGVKVAQAGTLLNDRSESLASRFRALFLLRNVKCDGSVSWICKCLSDPQETSALLKHELAYCLGQMQNATAIPCLIDVLSDAKQEPMVRHESGEALGAIGESPGHKVVEVLERFAGDPVPEVAETCQLALQRIEWLKTRAANEKPAESASVYSSIDPAPPGQGKAVPELAKILVDPSESLWNRYRAMFALRNLNTDEATKTLAQGLYCQDSALFRHEIAYVLGQVQSPVAIEELTYALVKSDENSMVRHEAAEALGAIATPECQKLLEKYAEDKERVVRESCEVALDMAEYELNNEFQYAKIEEPVGRNGVI